MQLNQKGFM